MSVLLPAIRAATPAPADAAPPELIRDIVPPTDYPWPLWAQLLIVAAIAAVVLWLGWLLWRRLSRHALPPPLLPRGVALAELARLRGETRRMEAYPFSIAVSHVLRRFSEDQFAVPALEQTSPEFLATIADRRAVEEERRVLLGDFLERCDAIKFGRAAGDAETNEALLSSAEAFVQGGRP